MLKIWSSWDKFSDSINLTCNEALVLYFQRDDQTPWNCAISAESLNNPELASQCINNAIAEMINNSYPEYWTPRARALREKSAVQERLDQINQFLESLGNE